MRRKHLYNLVEITLAMAVVGIGIAGIMALFVPAVNASRESVAENYSSQVAGTLLAYIEKIKKNDWNGTTGLYVNAKPIDSKVPQLSFEGALPKTTDWTKDKEIIPNVYKLENGVYGLKIGDGAEFCGYARVWSSNMSSLSEAQRVFDPDNGLASVDSKIIHLFLEVQWPATLPLANRNVRTYVFEFGKPQ